MRIVCWNMERKRASWDFLVDHHATDDLALLQEACTPTADAASQCNVGPGPWVLKGASGARAVVGLSPHLTIERFPEEPIRDLVPILQERRHATAAALVEHGDEQILFVSVEMYSDLALKLPDIAVALGQTLKHDGPAIIAGDLTTARNSGSPVFADMAAAGFPLVGPDNGPTFYNPRAREAPADAVHQLDYVFASPDLHDRITATALNTPDDWGPSDHCRILIELIEID